MDSLVGVEEATIKFLPKCACDQEINDFEGNHNVFFILKNWGDDPLRLRLKRGD